MKIFPASLTPLSPVLKKVDQWTQSDRGVFKKRILSRAVSLVATPPLALVSALYNAFAFTVKTPIVALRYTVLLLPIKKDGKWRMIGSLLPDSLGFKELMKHAAKVFAYVVDIFFGPLLGLVSPRANIWVHEKLGLITPRDKAPKVNPYMGGLDGAVNPSTPLIPTTEVPAPHRSRPAVNPVDTMPATNNASVANPQRAVASAGSTTQHTSTPVVPNPITPPAPPPPPGKNPRISANPAPNPTSTEAAPVQQRVSPAREETEEQRADRLRLANVLDNRRARIVADDEDDADDGQSGDDLFQVQDETPRPVVAQHVAVAPNLEGLRELIQGRAPARPQRQSVSLRDQSEWI